MLDMTCHEGEMLLDMMPTRVALIGCGAVSEILYAGAPSRWASEGEVETVATHAELAIQCLQNGMHVL